MADNQVDWQGVAVQQQARLQELEASQDKAVVDAALSAAIGTHPIHDHARGQVVDLLRGRVTLVPDGRGGRIAMADGKPVADFVREQVSSQPFAHFRRDSGSTAAAYTPGAADSQPPKTLQEGLIRFFAEQKTERGDFRTNPRIPFPTEPEKR